ncbi:hypothetical protein RHOFW104T7_14330 [Rhodanobacter thiooxydans]|uniref:Uncharacterized protein n=1 Tax=Rhodanobacter thiooxydans TaxID=416169 RepID=A0A154QGI1_9GAMM|nr:hypothetical protein [Rhodanobacter thiooxydans]EIM03297.1 hypothetical protein UUA_00080 [Rhodanobacter thiooxydans LCS2]KZC23349.1 hypothetical protein RHOFW104T7_14330 [Rhodanobacter thiooxydans]MCW0201230.1 hypothetical protein [Rhodanobacter thiooxydans]
MTQRSQQVPAVIAPVDHGRIAEAILDFVSEVPDSRIGNTPDPASEARRLANRAAQRAALAAGSLALPPGPLGWLTLLPEMIAIWKIQAQMVSDIAAAYGRHTSLGREQMMWCLFRHTAAQAFRDLVVRMGDRLLFRRVSYTVLERVAKQVGIKLTGRTLGKGVSRWLPVIGALGVGAYAYYDTGQVAGTAIELFEGEIAVEDAADSSGPQPTATATAMPTRRATDRLAGNAVTGAAHTLAAAARRATRRPRKPKAP